KQGERAQKLENLPTETVEYRLSEEEQVCSCCDGKLHEMSTETRSELIVIPAQVKVKKHVRYVYSCRYCEQHEIETPIVTAKMPSLAIGDGIYYDTKVCGEYATISPGEAFGTIWRHYSKTNTCQLEYVRGDDLA